MPAQPCPPAETVAELNRSYQEQNLPVTDGSRELHSLCAQLEFLLQVLLLLDPCCSLPQFPLRHSSEQRGPCVNHSGSGITSQPQRCLALGIRSHLDQTLPCSHVQLHVLQKGNWCMEPVKRGQPGTPRTTLLGELAGFQPHRGQAGRGRGHPQKGKSKLVPLPV